MSWMRLSGLFFSFSDSTLFSLGLPLTFLLPFLYFLATEGLNRSFVSVMFVSPESFHSKAIISL